MQLSKAAKALMAFVCIIVVALYSTNKRSSGDSGELRCKELEQIVDMSSATEQQSDVLMHFEISHQPNPPKRIGINAGSSYQQRKRNGVMLSEVWFSLAGLDRILLLPRCKLLELGDLTTIYHCLFAARS